MDPVAAVGTPAAAGASATTTSAFADAMSAVTLGAMVSNRSSATATTSTTPGGVLGLGQTPQITRISSLLTDSYSGRSSKTGFQIPAALLAYGNGKIPRDMLTLIGIGQHRLWSPAAEAFKSMRAAAAADGVNIGVTDSYRSYDEQVDLASRKGLYQNGGYAAVPGTSPHGWGLAVDVDVDPAGLAWLRAHGSQYNFVEAVPREPWHWEFHGAT